MPDPTPAPDLGATLLAECVARGLSVSELARRAGVPLSVCQQLLSGATTRPRLDTLLAVLGALGRDLGWLHRRGVRPPRPEVLASTDSA